jgi:hypothetical protein
MDEKCERGRSWAAAGGMVGGRRPFLDSEDQHMLPVREKWDRQERHG